MQAPSRRARIVAGLSLLLVLAMGAAVVAQDFAGALPFGLFNEGRALLRLLSLVCLIVLAGAALVFALEAVRGRRLAVAGTLRGLFVSLVLLELLITVLDVTVVSAPEGARLAGPYREAVSAAGTRVYLKAPHEGSPLGFRTAVPHPREAERPRVLFLGDSYTEGSGRAFACNYPEVAGAALAEGLGVEVEVMNAGVAGYGPVDALALYDYLVEEGYRFDAVVLSVFLENDFTDNLPGTQRRVVAGINFRFPRSAFLRWLHPLNTRTFRYLLFLARAGQLRFVADDEVRRGDGNCRPPSGRLGTGVRSLVERRLEANYRIDGPAPPTAEVSSALDGLASRAAAAGTPFAVVVFPDRILADPALAAQLGLPDPPGAYDLDRLRAFVASEVAAPALIDVTPALSGESGIYRDGDTHLSDRGNVAAGRWVGERLAARFRSLASGGTLVR